MSQSPEKSEPSLSIRSPEPGRTGSARAVAKTSARRDEVIEKVADFLMTHGLRAASLRPIAAAAGLSDRMLLYYFADKEEVMAAALQRAAQRLAATLGEAGITAPQSAADLEIALLALSTSDAVQPFMSLWLELAALATRGEPLYRKIGGAIALGFQSWIEARLDLPQPDKPAAARRLLSIIEGEVVLHSVGL